MMVSGHATRDSARVAAFLTSQLGGMLVLGSLLSAPLLTGFLGWLALELAPTVMRLLG